jgi:uncharacterized protein (TIGR01777 family)
MNILISGASGLIGNSLLSHLSQQGHQVFKLFRGPQVDNTPYYWEPELGKIHLDDKTQLDVVINLCGVNIGDRSWSKKRKEALIQSRVESTQLLSKALSQLEHPPTTFINASAIGFYGNSGAIEVDESSAAGDNFLTEIVTQWESSAQPTIDAGIRTVFIRSGIVLSTEGGALQKMLLPFKLGLGGRVGSGEQYMSWISLEDEIRGIEFVINNPKITGAVNLCSPHPVTNNEFSQTLGKVLNRPTIFPLPAFVVRLIFGEMGQLLLLEGCKVNPKKMTESGFKFSYPMLKEALIRQINPD